IHLITTASLRGLGRLLGNGPADERRFRPNLVIAADDGQFPEDAWLGRTLLIGSAVRLRVTQRCGRCVMTTSAHSDLAEQPAILQTLRRFNDVSFGVYAGVEAGGVIRVGDEVSYRPR